MIERSYINIELYVYIYCELTYCNVSSIFLINDRIIIKK